MSEILLENLCFGYTQDKLVLNNINLSLKKNNVIGIVGANGAGKTTLLRLLSGYLRPTSGRVTINGQEIYKLSASLRAKMMALVPQASNMDYAFSVADIVLAGRHAHLKRFFASGETEADYKIANEAMERTGILHLKNRSVLTLSGGEWQRMIIARAICQQSEIILLDEPVSNLDILNQVEILKTIRNLVNQNNITAICVLHDLSLTYNFCDYVAVISENKLFGFSSPEQILTPENIFTVYGIKTDLVKNNASTYILPGFD